MSTSAPSTKHEATDKWRRVWLKRTLKSMRLRIAVIVDRSEALLTCSLFQGWTAECILNHEALRVDQSGRLN